MSYSELFSSISCQCVIIFEDEFRQAKCTKNSALYDLARMDLQDRALFLDEVSRKYSEISKKIRIFLESVDKCFDAIGAWEEKIAGRDMELFIQHVSTYSPEQHEKLHSLYAAITEAEISTIYTAAAKFGIGAIPLTQYEHFFNEYIENENRKKSFRVYKDYSAATAVFFRRDLSQLGDTKSLVCIIDNQLGNEKRAGEIIGTIKETISQTKWRKVIGCIFSSHDQFEEIGADLHFEYSPKADIHKLEACLAKSAYNSYLSELRDETLSGIEAAFVSAQESKGIAYYLSRKAMGEGESEYQIINDWIRLLSEKAYAESDNIKHLIALSRVINSLEDEDDMGEPVEFLQKLNTLEAFDYDVNKYFLPIAAGDVFTDDNGKWYVLVGQDCDMARGNTRTPKNVWAELLPTDIRQQTEYKKWANNLETVSIYSFRKSIDERSEILQVKYQERKFIANEILSLCAYNDDGKCKISFRQEMSDEQKRIIPQYMVDYYQTLKTYYEAIKTIKEQAEEAFDIISKPEEKTPILISVNECSIDDNQIVYPLRRVCRLKHSYVFFLYKLFLEYRGRQPFQTINLARNYDVTMPVCKNKDATTQTEFSCFVRIVANPNDRGNQKNSCWLIDHTELTRISEGLGFGEPAISEDIVMLKEERMEFDLPASKKLVIQKAKKHILFYSE